MDAKELRTRTSQYRLRSQSLTNFESDSDSVPSSSASENRPVSRRRDSMSRIVPPPVSNSTSRSTNRASDPGSDWDFHDFLQHGWIDNWNSNQFPDVHSHQTELNPPAPARSVNHPLISQGFHITTHCNDPSSDEEEESSAQILADRYQRERMPVSFSPTSDEDVEDATERAWQARRLEFPSHHLLNRRRGRRREEPSRIEVMARETGQDRKEGPLAPHARFFIEREKSVVSVSFEPPV